MGPNLRKKRGGGARAGQLCSLPKMQKATAALKAPPGTFGCLQLKQNDVGALQLVEAKSWQPPKPSAEQTTHTTSMSHGQTAASLEKKSPSPFDEPILAHSVPHAKHSEIGVSQPGSFGHSNLNEQYAVESSYATVPLHSYNYRLGILSRNSEDAGVYTRPSAANVAVAHARDLASLPLLDPLPHPSSPSPHGLQPMSGSNQTEESPSYVSTPTQPFPDTFLAPIQSPDPRKSSGTLSSAGGPVRSNRTRHRACPVPRSRDRPQQLFPDVLPQYDEAFLLQWLTRQHPKRIKVPIDGTGQATTPLYNAGYDSPDFCDNNSLPEAVGDHRVPEPLFRKDVMAFHAPTPRSHTAMKPNISTFSTLASALDIPAHH